jgi:hypothetical protein
MSTVSGTPGPTTETTPSLSTAPTSNRQTTPLPSVRTTPPSSLIGNVTRSRRISLIVAFGNEIKLKFIFRILAA